MPIKKAQNVHKNNSQLQYLAVFTKKFRFFVIWKIKHVSQPFLYKSASAQFCCKIWGGQLGVKPI